MLQILQCLRFRQWFLIVTVQNPDGRQMQMNLTGFLNAKNARTFIQELWDLLLSAQENIGGIPAVFLEQKKEEIKMRQVYLFINMSMILLCCTCFFIHVHHTQHFSSPFLTCCTMIFFYLFRTSVSS